MPTLSCFFFPTTCYTQHTYFFFCLALCCKSDNIYEVQLKKEMECSERWNYKDRKYTRIINMGMIMQQKTQIYIKIYNTHSSLRIPSQP